MKLNLKLNLKLKKTLYLIRHAEIESQYEGRYIGSTDVPLSAAGVNQARLLGKYVETKLKTGNFSFFSSPLLRCQQTWTEMSLRNTENPKILRELQEINFGLWEKMTFSEIQFKEPDEIEGWANFSPHFCFPQGESLQNFINRMKGLRKYFIELNSDSIAVITHGGVITTLICLFLGLSPSQYLLFKITKPSLSSLDIFENGQAVLTSLNDFPWGYSWPK